MTLMFFFSFSTSHRSNIFFMFIFFSLFIR